MADIKSPANPLFLREDELRQGIEMLFFAYRDFVSDPDRLLAEFGPTTASSISWAAIRA